MKARKKRVYIDLYNFNVSSDTTDFFKTLIRMGYLLCISEREDFDEILQSADIAYEKFDHYPRAIDLVILSENTVLHNKSLIRRAEDEGLPVITSSLDFHWAKNIMLGHEGKFSNSQINWMILSANHVLIGSMIQKNRPS